MAAIPRRPLLASAVVLALAGPGIVLANDGQLLLVTGNVTIHRDSAAPIPGLAASRIPTAPAVVIPSAGEQVQSGDTIITGHDGRAQIRFSDGSLVSLQPRTEFRIERYRYDTADQRGFFSLAVGAIRAVSGRIGKRNPADYRLTTPSATIGIRGTQFVVEQTVCDPACYPGRSAGLRVAVNEGHIVVGNRAGSIEVPAGEAAFAATESTAPIPTSDRPQLTTVVPATSPATRVADAGAATRSADNRGDGGASASGNGSGSGSGSGSESTNSATGSAAVRTASVRTAAAASASASASVSTSAAASGRLGSDIAAEGNTIRSVADLGRDTAISIGEARDGQGRLVVVDPAALAPAIDGGGGGTSSGNGTNPGGGTNTGGGTSTGGGTNPGGGSNPGGGTNTGGGTTTPPLPRPALGPGLNDIETGAFMAPSSWAVSWLGSVEGRPTFDDQMQLQSIGNCPGTLCLSRGTARVVDAGGNDSLRWGRWIDGVATLWIAGVSTALPQTANRGLHYLVGVPTVTMPTTGDARYTLDGATAATWSAGTGAAGTFSGEARVQFGTGAATRIGVDANVQFGDGTHYRMQSQGGLADVSASELRMSGRTTFGGNIGVQGGAVDPVGCQTGNCRANVSGGFFGPDGRQMGIQYSVGRTPANAPAGALVNQTGSTIQGVAGFTRADPAP